MKIEQEKPAIGGASFAIRDNVRGAILASDKETVPNTG